MCATVNASRSFKNLRPRTGLNSTPIVDPRSLYSSRGTRKPLVVHRSVHRTIALTRSTPLCQSRQCHESCLSALHLRTIVNGMPQCAVKTFHLVLYPNNPTWMDDWLCVKNGIRLCVLHCIEVQCNIVQCNKSTRWINCIRLLVGSATAGGSCSDPKHTNQQTSKPSRKCRQEVFGKIQ
ncbi:unnamed protein product [Pseudo-nitzschia multistriata]|uniref:Uncharacterized protein n=1 Tax=Pseudo-nitzschia multistriata TaxID=183589 RepID=A0A448ZDX7_9STRA|nr:unnamed protein product [Pseudo-nitzschia multistriata]